MNPITKLARTLFFSEHFILYLSLVYFIILWLFLPYVANARNLSNMASNMWPLLALAIGQMFVLIIGGIDLSQTSIMAVVSVLGAAVMSSQVDPVLFEKSPLWGLWLSQEGGWLGGHPAATPVAILLMLLVGMSIGWINGVSGARFNMPPFMVSLISMMFFSGLAIYLTASENITHLPEGFIAIGKGGIGWLSFAFLIVLILAVVAHLILKRTGLGRWFFAVGMNI